MAVPGTELWVYNADFLGIFFNILQNWLRDQGENQKKLFLGLPNVWGGEVRREGGEVT